MFWTFKFCFDIHFWLFWLYLAIFPKHPVTLALSHLIIPALHDEFSDLEGHTVVLQLLGLTVQPESKS